MLFRAQNFTQLRKINFINHFYFTHHLCFLINSKLCCLLIDRNMFKLCDQTQGSWSNLRKFLVLIFALKLSNTYVSELSSHLITSFLPLEVEDLPTPAQSHLGLVISLTSIDFILSSPRQNLRNNIQISPFPILDCTFTA